MKKLRLAQTLVTVGATLVIALTGSVAADAAPSNHILTVSAPVVQKTQNPEDIVRPREMPVEVAVKLAATAEDTYTVNATNPVVTSWLDKANRRVYARSDAVAKYKAHGLTTPPVRAVTQWADNVTATGTSYVYLTEIGSPSRGWVPVKVVVDYRAYGTQTFGVVTAYCTTGQVCPSWVNTIVG